METFHACHWHADTHTYTNTRGHILTRVWQTLQTLLKPSHQMTEKYIKATSFYQHLNQLANCWWSKCFFFLKSGSWQTGNLSQTMPLSHYVITVCISLCPDAYVHTHIQWRTFCISPARALKSQQLIGIVSWLSISCVKCVVWSLNQLKPLLQYKTWEREEYIKYQRQKKRRSYRRRPQDRHCERKEKRRRVQGWGRVLSLLRTFPYALRQAELYEWATG